MKVIIGFLSFIGFFGLYCLNRTNLNSLLCASKIYQYNFATISVFWDHFNVMLLQHTSLVTITSSKSWEEFVDIFFHFKLTVDYNCTTLIFFQLSHVCMILGEEMVSVMMQLIMLHVILMMETVVDHVSIENIAQIVYACLKNQMLQVIKTL